MPGILATCEELFGTKDLYTVLGIEKTATADQIKKAYRKLSLSVHPDKVTEQDRPLCTSKFQCVGRTLCPLF